MIIYGGRVAFYELAGNSVILHFTQAEGLVFTGDPRRSFFVADANRTFLPADEVTIRGADLIVRSEIYGQLMAVRYAWANNPTMTLYNGAGYPASPFRTDEWCLQG